MALSEKLNILFPRPVDESSIDVTPAAVATLPAEDALKVRRDKFMRVIGTTCEIKLNLASLTKVTGMAIQHNLKDGSTIRVRLWNTTGQSTGKVYDSTSQLSIDESLNKLFPQISYFPFNEVDAISLRIDITAPTNTEIDIGRIMIGSVFEPDRNFSQGAKWQWIEDGNERIVGNKYRVFNLTMKMLKNAENGAYENEKMMVGKQNDVFVCLHPTSTGLDLLKNSAFCRIANNIARISYKANDNKQTDTFKEVY